MSKMPATLGQGGPTSEDFLKARAFIERNYLRTLLYPSALLSQEHGCEVFVKYENHGPVRSFKARGALYRLSLLSADERQRGVVAASTGNHGQGIAYAGRVLSIPTAIVVPQDAPRIKTDNIRFLGSELVMSGQLLSDSEHEARSISRRTGKILIEDGEDAGLMAGAGSIAWEILDQLPNASAIIVPVGGGNLIAATAFVAKMLRPDIRIIGVQSAAAPSVYESWRQGAVKTEPCTTFAGGLATSHPGTLAFSVLQNLVDSIMLVSEEELRNGIMTALMSTGQLTEGAGAASFAALPKVASTLRGQKVVLLLTGGNLPVEDLKQLLQSEPAA
jgi:threonine dehydratase